MCQSLVAGPFTVFRVDGEESVVVHQPDESVAAEPDAAEGPEVDACSQHLEIDDEAFPGDSVPESNA